MRKFGRWIDVSTTAKNQIFSQIMFVLQACLIYVEWVNILIFVFISVINSLEWSIAVSSVSRLTARFGIVRSGHVACNEGDDYRSVRTTKHHDDKYDIVVPHYPNEWHSFKMQQNTSTIIITNRSLVRQMYTTRVTHTRCTKVVSLIQISGCEIRDYLKKESRVFLSNTTKLAREKNEEIL